MSSSEKSDNEKKFNPPPKEAFVCKQIDLFQTFLCNGDEQREKLSNAVPLWDCLPLYSVSRQWATKMQKESTFPKLLIRHSVYQGGNVKVDIQPARLMENGVVNEYYPGGTEELIEAALRKIATLQNHGYHNDDGYGACFSIYQLRKELKNRGHSRSYQQIIQSLRILARSSIEIVLEKDGAKVFDSCNYLRRLSSVSKSELSEDPNAKWYVEFHPLITKALRAMDYRQFDYELMMSHDTQLTRWLHKYLVAKFTFAAIGQKFEIRFSTISRDSGLLESFGSHRKAMQYVRSSLADLVEKGILEPKLLHVEGKEKFIPFDESKILGQGGKIEDVVYTIYPSAKFTSESKKANANAKLIREKSDN